VVSSVKVSINNGQADAAMERIVDGSGLSDRDNDEFEEHTCDISDMWQSNKERKVESIEFNFGTLQKLDLIEVWNFNQKWFTQRGLKRADISVWNESVGWKKVLEGVEFHAAEGNDDYDEPTLIRLNGIEAAKVRFDNLQGRDDLECIGLSEVLFCKVKGPQAMRPQPANGIETACMYNLTLSWSSGLNAVAHNLYFGTESESLELLGKIDGSSSARLSKLAYDTNYFWRVDEIQEDGSIVTGELWSFKTGGLVGLWKFDESEGSTAEDCSVSGNNCILKNNAVWQSGAGKFGGAVKFVDDSSCVEVPTDGMSPSAGTIAMWVKLSPEQKIPDTRYLYGHTTEPYYSNRIQLYMDGSTTMLNLGLGDSHYTITDMVKLEVDTWSHTAFTWNEGTFVVYVNGKEVGSGNYSGLEELHSAADIGNNGRPPDRRQSFNGLIDEVRIYDCALNHEEIKTIYSGEELASGSGAALITVSEKTEK
jgi:hypothetical protein